MIRVLLLTRVFITTVVTDGYQLWKRTLKREQEVTRTGSVRSADLRLDDSDGLSVQFVRLIWDQLTFRQSFHVLRPDPSLPLLHHLKSETREH